MSASLQVEHTEHHGLKGETGMAGYEAPPRLGHLIQRVIAKRRVSEAIEVCAWWIVH